MNMETTRLANVYWLSIPDRQVVALRAAWWSSNGSGTASAPPRDEQPRRVPMLDWPPSLFADEVRH